MQLRRPDWMEPVDSFGEWFGLLVGAAIVLFAVVSLLPFTLHRLPDQWWCVDPTDSCNYSTYRVRNDTAATVVVSECAHYCGRGDERYESVAIRRGATREDGVQAPVGVMDWWEVRTQNGRLLGCLVLDGHHREQDGRLVVVSAARVCGDARSRATATATG